MKSARTTPSRSRMAFRESGESREASIDTYHIADMSELVPEPSGCAHLNQVGWKGSMTRRFGNAGGESHRRHTSGHDDILLGEDHQCRRAIGIARGRLLPTPLTSDGEALEPGQSRSPLDPGAPSLLTCTSRGNAENRERVAIGKSFPGDFMKLPAQCDHLPSAN